MAANLKINLQDMVFRPKCEKLVHVLELAKPCITQGEESPYLRVTVTKEDVKITYLITAEKIRRVHYNINGVWLVKDLMVINGKEGMQYNPRFDMHFEQVHTLEAFSTAAKYAFAHCVRELSKTNYGRDVEFL